MPEDEIKTYDELEPEQKEVFDTFRKMKFSVDYANFRYQTVKLEDLLEDYEKLRKLRENIQEKYFSIYEELLSEDLINDVVDASEWASIRDQEKETWDTESNMMLEIKEQLELAMSMIESGEADRMYIEAQNSLGI